MNIQPARVAAARHLAAVLVAQQDRAAQGGWGSLFCARKSVCSGCEPAGSAPFVWLRTRVRLGSSGELNHGGCVHVGALILEGARARLRGRAHVSVVWTGHCAVGNMFVL